MTACKAFNMMQMKTQRFISQMSRVWSSITVCDFEDQELMQCSLLLNSV